MQGLKGNKHKRKLGVPFAVCMQTAKSTCGSSLCFRVTIWSGQTAFAVLPSLVAHGKAGGLCRAPSSVAHGKEGEGVGRAVSSPCSSHGVAHGKEKILPCSLMVGTRQRSSDVAPSVKWRFRLLNFRRVPRWKAHGESFSVFRAERHTAKVICRAVFRRVDFAVFRHTARALPCSGVALLCILPTRQIRVFL
jgi:hypothetical protein